MHDAGLDQLCIDTMPGLPIDRVQRANSGHSTVQAVLERRHWLANAIQNSEGA